MLPADRLLKVAENGGVPVRLVATENDTYGATVLADAVGP
jgi:hypothetical protein